MVAPICACACPSAWTAAVSRDWPRRTARLKREVDQESVGRRSDPASRSKRTPTRRGGVGHEREGSRAMTSTTPMPLADFVQAVRKRCDGALDPLEMGRFLTTARIEPTSLGDFVRFAPGRYTRHLVHKDRNVELLV